MNVKILQLINLQYYKPNLFYNSLPLDAVLPCSLSDNEDGGLDQDEFGLYDEIDMQEKIEYQMFTKFEKIYGIDKCIFNPREMVELKIRGNDLIERNQKRVLLLQNEAQKTI